MATTSQSSPTAPSPEPSFTNQLPTPPSESQSTVDLDYNSLHANSSWQNDTTVNSSGANSPSPSSSLGVELDTNDDDDPLAWNGSSQWSAIGPRGSSSSSPDSGSCSRTGSPSGGASPSPTSSIILGADPFADANNTSDSRI
jgi:hypothetical protein